jgi:hypothetical protein
MAIIESSSAENRFNEEGDWMAQQFFSADDLRMPPEEYAARHAQLVGCFALHRYRYRDPVLGAWVHRLGEILSSAGEVERCQLQFLDPEEMAIVRNEEAEGL